MAESIIFNLPVEIRPEHTEKYIVPYRSDGSLHLEKIHFRASQGSEGPTNIFVVAGSDGSTSRVMTSQDGINWNIVSDPGFSPTRFGYAVAYNGSIIVVACDNNFLISTDGANTFSSISSPFTTGVCFDVIWADTLNLFIAGGKGPGTTSATLIYTSLDGTTWSSQTTPWDSEFDGFSFGPGVIDGLGWSNTLGQIVATGNNFPASSVILTSSDAITWTSQASPMDDGQSIRAGWSSDINLWASVGAGGGYGIQTSSNGTSWTGRLIGGFGADVLWIRELGLFVAVSSSTWSGAAIVTSATGISWTGRTSPWNSIGAQGVMWSPTLGLGVIVSEGANGVLTSDDAITWTHQTVAFKGNRGIALI